MKNRNSFVKSFLYEIIGIVIIIMVSLILFLISKLAGFIALSGAIIYGIILFIVYSTGRFRIFREIDSNALPTLITGMVEKIDSPVMIVNESNSIVWCNDEFAELSEVKKERLSSGASKLFGGVASYANMSAAYDSYTDFISIETENSFYEIRVFPLELKKQKLFASVWYSRDNERQLKNKLEDTAIRVAYIVIDNSNEVSQEIQENRRFGSATVNKLLTEWAETFDAILTEYDRDKYVMQFENRFLQTMIDSKFDILDKVVESSLGESPVPITISIGVSSGNGTLNEKRESAQAALRSALQRGGALAVIRTENGEDSYGGKTKAVQRQTKIRSRLCRDLLTDQIPKCSNVIIMGHLRPDFDSIASNIGIAKLVQSFGKEYCIVADVNDKSISKIIESISQFPEYETVFVDAVYAQELLTPNTLVIVTDASNPEIFAARGVYDNASKVVVIDHHAIKETLGDQVLQPSNIDPTASSASELVCEILELSMSPGSLRPEEAQILLAGILLDTQFFSRDTGTRTYSACIFLKNAGADAGKAKNLFKSDKAEFLTVRKIEQSMEVYRDKFAISTYSESVDPQNKITASKAAEGMVDIDGISASFVLYTQENGINLSARSDGTINVINIAKMLGGGGHFQSAGALIREIDDNGFGNVVFDIKKAEKILKDAIDSYIGETKEGK
jgi:c-di-AMP phosphodiesterase-like protein